MVAPGTTAARRAWTASCGPSGAVWWWSATVPTCSRSVRAASCSTRSSVPSACRELAKMDGAIIVASDASRIARANVHLMPEASTIPTTETGTRHRTAERVARSIDVPVLSVSAAMSVIAVYRNDLKHTMQPTGWLHDRTDQALATMQRFRSRFDVAFGNLSILEVEDTVSVGDVVAGDPGGRDGPAHRRGGRRLPGRAGRGRATGRPAVGRAGRRRGPGARPGRARLLRDDTDGDRRSGRSRRGVGRRASWPTCHRTSCAIRTGWRRSSGCRARSTTPSRESSPAATVSSTTCRGSPTPSSSGSSTGSSTSSRSCGPRWPSSRRWKGSARPGPTSVKEGLARLAEASIFERYQ